MRYRGSRNWNWRIAVRRQRLLAVGLVLGLIGTTEALYGAAEEDFDFLVAPPTASVIENGGLATIDIVLKTRYEGVQGWSLGMILESDADDSFWITALKQGELLKTIQDGVPPDVEILSWYTADDLSRREGSCSIAVGPCAGIEAIGFTHAVAIDTDTNTTLDASPDGIVVANVVVGASASGQPGDEARLTFSNALGTPRFSTAVRCNGEWLYPLLKEPGVIRIVASRRFIRGNSNAVGAVDMADAIYILQYLFADGLPSPCEDAADSNDTGAIDMADAIYILQYLFAEGPELPAPFEACGVDESPDSLTCDSSFCEPRYVDNGDGTVRDTDTGLMWQQATADTNGDGEADRLTWYEALDYCDSLILCNDGTWANDSALADAHGGVKLDDWRLPWVQELMTLLDTERVGHPIDPVFTTEEGGYWSASPIPEDLHNAFCVLFWESGGVSAAHKLAPAYVRAVRTIQPRE